MKPDKLVCLFVFVSVSGIDRAQVAIDFEMRWNN